MNLKTIGAIIAILGLIFTVYFMDNWDYIVLGLTFVMFGFLIALFGLLSGVKKQKIINDRLDKDIETFIQPVITKYSNLNKEYMKSCSQDEYVQKRMQMNKDLEMELAEGLPYLSKNEIKKIVIEFNRNQDSL
ncbi:MAG: hypothetical protein Q4P18_00500 [Methanobrevibacter sp.]|uniref:hypothetical protein n=1 Tax=Methanobrevibacter sp. TaxID=66852 RepID=UPI0026DFB453|nr:hypothetical protein [Methanobrevibacter sp.]MDO5848002.1 hypothetical protein [Methanobrevibacter sp.]